MVLDSEIEAVMLSLYLKKLQVIFACIKWSKKFCFVRLQQKIKAQIYLVKRHF